MYNIFNKDEHGEEYAQKNTMAFMETSAMEGHNIDEAFNHMIAGIPISYPRNN